MFNFAYVLEGIFKQIKTQNSRPSEETSPNEIKPFGVLSKGKYVVHLSLTQQKFLQNDNQNLLVTGA